VTVDTFMRSVMVRNEGAAKAASTARMATDTVASMSVNPHAYGRGSLQGG
jgi:hypothetical protein